MSGGAWRGWVLEWRRQRLNSTPLEVGSGSTVIAQGDYNFSLAAVSSGPSGSSQDTLLYAGTIDLSKLAAVMPSPTRKDTSSSSARPSGRA